MSTEHLLREFYNQMYRVHTQPDNAYDLGDHLHHLTVHKHLDQDPLIQFREAYRWVDQAGARLVADAWDRKFADSSLEEEGFEPSVPLSRASLDSWGGEDAGGRSV